MKNYRLVQVGIYGYKALGGDPREVIQDRYLLGSATDPEPWGYFNGNKIRWKTRKFVDGAPLSNEKPSVTTQDNK